METILANVGDQLSVLWSNGQGYTNYNIIDNPQNDPTKPHLFQVVSEFEFGPKGELIKVVGY